MRAIKKNDAISMKQIEYLRKYQYENYQEFD